MVVDIAQLGEYRALSPERINRLAPLFSGPLPERARPRRKKIDYCALRAQYERLLLDGACATKADVARHVGVSRLLKGIKNKLG